MNLVKRFCDQFIHHLLLSCRPINGKVSNLLFWTEVKGEPLGILRDESIPSSHRANERGFYILQIKFHDGSDRITIALHAVANQSDTQEVLFLLAAVVF